jgi:hypothetical protein
MIRTLLALSILALLTGCEGPALEAFNDRGGVITYHMVSSNMSDVLRVADDYCAKLGKKATLGSPSIGMTSMNVSFQCVE